MCGTIKNHIDSYALAQKKCNAKFVKDIYIYI